MDDLVIVGAGAAGLGAASSAASLGLATTLVEASHRIGGRAYSEDIAPGIAFDLGCHWLHSASLNPFVADADALGLRYVAGPRFTPRLFADGAFASAAEHEDFHRYWQACESLLEADGVADIAVAEAIDRDSRWTPWYDYWTALMTSVDADRVSALDLSRYHDTGENWPVVDGYGELVRRRFAHLPVTLNCAVRRIERRRDGMRVHTVRGVLEARAVLVTVSTGVLAAGAIEFHPGLPPALCEAIAAVPVGNHNRIALRFRENPFGTDAPAHVIDLDGDVPMLIDIRPDGHDYAVGVTAGRYASWLERQGTEAAVEHLLERLSRLFGSAVERQLAGRIVTAWGSDPWTLGAYSACLPGQAHQRAVLAEPVDGRLWFAGEATSLHHFATCHGACQAGIDAVHRIAEVLATPAAGRGH